MKTKIILSLTIALLLGLPQAPKGQSLAQLVEQLDLDYQKLAQLKQMLSDMYTGYKKVRNGYERVRSIAQDNFNLHKVFLDALLSVSPVVRNYVKVQHIINSEAQLVKEYQSARSYLKGTGLFTGSELDAFNSMSGDLLNGSLRNLDELTDVLTDNTLRMNDAERLAAIDRIDNDMTNRLSILQTFDNTAAIQAGQRGIELNNIITMQNLNGNN